MIVFDILWLLSDPDGCIEVFSKETNLYYGHVASSVSNQQHSVQYHGRILSRLIDDPVHHYNMTGTVPFGSASSKRREGWVIHVHINSSSLVERYYLQTYLESNGLGDLIIDN